MNGFMTSLIWVSLGSSVLVCVVDPNELEPPNEEDSLEARCPDYCMGDFPVSTNRKFARIPAANEGA
jgi:hypothetical protein